MQVGAGESATETSHTHYHSRLSIKGDKRIGVHVVKGKHVSVVAQHMLVVHLVAFIYSLSVLNFT